MSEINPDAALVPHQNPWAVLNKLSIAEWLRAHGKFVRPELTKKQRLELKECFELIDADGSGAISSSEMLTAFHVLGIRTKRSEVEEMLASVDSDGSGEVEYPEFVQIMTTKMDSQTQEEEPRASKPGKAQPLPFPLLAQAYRRKKLMEAVMQGDKATQERLQARAEEMEQERVAAIAELEAQKRQVKKRPKVLSQITKERIRKQANLQKKEADLPLPGYILENIDEEVKQVLFGVHERASLRRMSMHMSHNEKEHMEKSKSGKETHPSDDKADAISVPSKPQPAAGFSGIGDEDSSKLQPTGSSETAETKSVHEGMPVKDSKRFTISNLDGGQNADLSKQMQAYYKEELTTIHAVRSKLRDKPTREQQRIRLQAVQSIGTYYQREDSDSKILIVNNTERERIETPWRVPSQTKRKVRERNTSHARIIYVPPPKPVKRLRKENKRPEWICHLNSKRQDNSS
ncbi:unnamed protein product [Calypogeia fissa]